MDGQNKNLILATALSFLVILGWFVAGPLLFPQWFPETPVVDASQTAATEAVPPAANDTETTAATEATSTEPLPDAPRLASDKPKLSGSLSVLV